MLKRLLIPAFFAFGITAASAAETNACAGLPALHHNGQPIARAIVGKPLLAAVALLKARKGKEALAQAADAERVEFKTPFEACLVNQVVTRARVLAAQGL